MERAAVRMDNVDRATVKTSFAVDYRMDHHVLMTVIVPVEDALLEDFACLVMERAAIEMRNVDLVPVKTLFAVDNGMDSPAVMTVSVTVEDALL